MKNIKIQAMSLTALGLVLCLSGSSLAMEPKEDRELRQTVQEKVDYFNRRIHALLNITKTVKTETQKDSLARFFATYLEKIDQVLDNAAQVNRVHGASYMVSSGNGRTCNITQFIRDLTVERGNYEQKIRALGRRFEPRSQCFICFDKKAKSASYQFSCNHSYCKACLNEIIDTGLREKSSRDFKCPEPSCRTQFEEADIRAITNNNRVKINLFLDIKMQEWMTTQQNAKHCPTPNCEWSFLYEDGVRGNITCPQCHSSYCSGCLLPHAMHITCAQAAAANSNRDSETEKWIESHSKKCPRCSTAIEKNEGCNHMNCVECGYNFCWICLRERPAFGGHTCIRNCPQCNLEINYDEHSVREWHTNMECDRCHHRFCWKCLSPLNDGNATDFCRG